MPTIFKTHAVSPASLATHAALDSAIVAATPNQVKFAGLLLNLPFGKRGSLQTRAIAKGFGARWDGKEWTLPASKYVDVGARRQEEVLDWLRTNNLIAGIKTREYTNWIWDGRAVDLALELPFEDRHIAKQNGAKWDGSFARWYLPASELSLATVDALNKAEAIVGEINNQNNQKSVATTGSSGAPSAATSCSQPMALRSAHLLHLVAERCAALNMINLAASGLSEGERSPGVVARLREAEAHPFISARPKHLLARLSAIDGLFVYFVEVPTEVPGGCCAIAMIAVPGNQNGRITAAPMAGYAINDFITSEIAAAMSRSLDTLQGVFSREDAIRLYEDLCNDHQFKQFTPDPAA